MRSGKFWALFYKLKLYFISLRYLLTIIFFWQLFVTLLSVCATNVMLLLIVGILLLVNLFLCY